MWIWEAEHAKAVIVMVHGAGEHHGRYKWLCSQWVANGFHVVMGDLPGQGATRRNRGHIYSFNEYIDTIEKWVESASQFELPVFLFGHSMGGLAVIRALTEKELPVNAVILSSPCLGIVYQPPKPVDALSRVINRVYPTLRLTSHRGFGKATRSKERIEKDIEDVFYVKKVSIRWYRELMNSIKIAHRSVGQFPDVPLLVLQAGNDLIVDKESVRSWFNKLNLMEKSYKEWPELYHEILNDPERDQVFQYVSQFVNLLLTFEENLQKE
ncbi:alpha/beta hydrolase [Pseudalkalibacillus salsuginis]|uniref:alpha/beta hydrolase n=1 Tax=Pseudalkalibacillus salsuginis TaxID=2910972 RepID=UPI001F46E103|nr:alpha/beta hydrolase [Pseudalkalibacillus salsuginis]MCF6408866.1 alpha/beta hydrolase [Pseudalkalibacillus salsuginis]